MSDFAFAVALNLKNRRCVVVGGGSIGTRRVKSLLEAGATEIVVVAPNLSDELRTTIAESGNITAIHADFAPEHLDGAFLAIAATDNPIVNQAVADVAKARKVLLNQAAAGDDTDEANGDFAVMATVRRGDLLFGVTTGGGHPALSAFLRQSLAEQYTNEWAEFVVLLSEMRIIAKREIADVAVRTAALRQLTRREDIRAQLKNGDADGAYAEARRCLFE